MITVHGRANSSNVQKVLWALRELGLAYERVDAGGRFGRLDTEEFARLSPFARVPVLVEDGLVLPESNAILRHLGRVHGTGRFWPADEHAVAWAEAVMDWSLSALWPAIRPAFLAVARNGADPRGAEVAALLEATAEPMGMLESLCMRGPWLAGEAFSFADIPAAIAVSRLVWLKGETVLPPATALWYAACAARPAWKGTVEVDETPKIAP